ncbi:GNAT family N-acetyltransferase [Bacillus gaemokensis]|uniref:GNAT family acetyltransferase n=1 Tax=Bacillus gaemokensis TaxID=574375 RepID=A0A073K3W5_9BACI|nr:GNAT family protein [Bacillus gaemokensis]KEK21167.1 GNAT family acetyltransferase [Bacillus gaemokensis]KYG37814.1 GNAT family acetyltransferase [Bacillus gaemokensis]
MINIRKAKVKDAREIVAIKKEIVETTEFFLRSPEEPQEKAEEYQKKIQTRQKNGGLTLVVEFNDQVIGFLSFSRSSYIRLHHAGSFGMGIKQEFSNIGIGTKFLSYFIEWAKEQEGLEKICLDVFSNNERAINLYKRLGFREEGRQINQIRFKDGSYADIVFMALYIKIPSTPSF